MSSLRQGIEINGERINLRGKIKLIYIDPPFATGADFSFKVPMPELAGTDAPKRDRQESLHHGGTGLSRHVGRADPGGENRSYLNYMYDRLVLMKELLADDGSIYVHLDYRWCIM